MTADFGEGDLDRHQRELHVHCCRLLSSYDAAEDAVQGERHRDGSVRAGGRVVTRERMVRDRLQVFRAQKLSIVTYYRVSGTGLATRGTAPRITRR